MRFEISFRASSWDFDTNVICGKSLENFSRFWSFAMFVYFSKLPFSKILTGSYRTVYIKIRHGIGLYEPLSDAFS